MKLFFYFSIIILMLNSEFHAQTQENSSNSDVITHFTVINDNDLNFKDDTFFLNRSTFYLNKYFNFRINEDSLIDISDTIITRISEIEVLDTINKVIFKRCKQVVSFLWSKKIELNEELFTPFTSAYKNSDSRFEEGCINYYWNTGPTGNCEAKVICDLSNSDTYTWCSGTRYTKIFEDNFLGDKLDETYWKMQCDWGNEINEDDLAWQLKRNVRVNNGTLKLDTKKETVLPMVDIDGTVLPLFNNRGGSAGPIYKQYSSSMITSLFQYGYGKYEMKAKVPYSVGVNPTYWLNDGNLEIDGFEFFYMNRDDAPYMTVYSDKNNDLYPWPCAGYHNLEGGPKKNRIYQVVANKSVWKNMNFPNLADGNWYIFTIVYDPNYIEWWVEREDHSELWGLVYYNVFQQGYLNPDPNSNCSCTGCVVHINPGFPDNFNGETKFMIGNGPTTSKDWVFGNGVVTGPYDGTVSTLEVDWVKIYVPDNCIDDITKSNGNFRSINEGNKNHITGNNIVLGGDGEGHEYKVEYIPWGDPNFSTTDYSPNTYLRARANNELALLDGFVVQEGGLFEGTIAFQGFGSYNSDCNTLNSYPQYFRKSNISSTDSVKDKSTNFDTNTFSVFPNPSSNVISISSKNKIQSAEFYNSLGVNVYNVKASFDSIDVSFLPTGIYFIKITFATSEIITKFVKQSNY